MSDRQRGNVIELPADAVNEQVVIAAAMTDPEVRERLLTQIPADEFLIDEHRATWIGLLELRRRGLAFDLATLGRLVDSERVSLEYLSGIAATRDGKAPNLEEHLSWLRWDRIRADAARGSLSALLQALQDPREAPEHVRALAKHVGTAFGVSTSPMILAPDGVIESAMSEIRRRIAGHACYPYGIDGLDKYETGAFRMLPGTAPGQMTVVTAAPGVGKSTFTANVVLGLAKQKRRVIYGAWEMNSPMTLEILAVISLGWMRTDTLDPNSAALAGRTLDEERLRRLRTRMEKISQFVRFLPNPFRRGPQSRQRRTNAHNLDVLQAALDGQGCDVFIGDLWKRCLVDTEPDQEEEALIRQQAMCEELGMHAILLQQQRHKETERRADPRPTREGIKGSGAWTEAADTIIGVHRQAHWKTVEDDRMEVFILKQRYGKWPLAVELRWDPERGHISGGRSIRYDPPGREAQADPTTEWINSTGGRSKAGR